MVIAKVRKCHRGEIFGEERETRKKPVNLRSGSKKRVLNERVVLHTPSRADPVLDEKLASRGTRLQFSNFESRLAFAETLRLFLSHSILAQTLSHSSLVVKQLPPRLTKIPESRNLTPIAFHFQLLLFNSARSCPITATIVSSLSLFLLPGALGFAALRGGDSTGLACLREIGQVTRIASRWARMRRRPLADPAAAS